MCNLCTDEGDTATCEICGCRVCMDITSDQAVRLGLLVANETILCEFCELDQFASLN
jgi:hypothetical protein